MRKRRKILWYRLLVVLITRLPAGLILWPVMTIGEYAERLYEWCDDHLPTLGR
jgi:hypothetical protein